MTSEPSDLVNNYFADRLSPREVSELDAALQNEPATADAFALAARSAAAQRFAVGNRAESPEASILETARQRAAFNRRIMNATTMVTVVVILLAVSAPLWINRLRPKSRPLPPPASTHRVTAGTVLINNSAAKAFYEGDELRVGDQLAALELANGTQIDLKPESVVMLRLAQEPESLALDLKRGGATIRVPLSAKPFRIETNAGHVSIRPSASTDSKRPHEFTVSVLPDRELQVGVATGIVQVTTDRGIAWLATGEQHRFQADEEWEVPVNVTGTFQSADLADGTIAIQGESETSGGDQYRVVPETSVTLDGRSISLRELRPGMRIKLTLSIAKVVVAAEALASSP